MRILFILDLLPSTRSTKIITMTRFTTVTNSTLTSKNDTNKNTTATIPPISNFSSTTTFTETQTNRSAEVEDSGGKELTIIGVVSGACILLCILILVCPIPRLVFSLFKKIETLDFFFCMNHHCR